MTLSQQECCYAVGAVRNGKGKLIYKLYRITFHTDKITNKLLGQSKKAENLIVTYIPKEAFKATVPAHLAEISALRELWFVKEEVRDRLFEVLAKEYVKEKLHEPA